MLRWEDSSDWEKLFAKGTSDKELLSKNIQKFIICHQGNANKTRYHYVLIRIVKSQNTDNIKCWRGYGATGNLIHCYGNAKWYSYLARPFVGFRPYDLASPSLVHAQRIWKLQCTRKPARDVYIIFIYNWQNLEATKMFLRKWINYGPSWQWKIVFMILWWWVNVIIYLSKTIECTTSEGAVKYCGLWVIMCQCSLIGCDHIPFWWVIWVTGEVGGVEGCGGQEVGEVSAASPHFCYETKTALKIYLNKTNEKFHIQAPNSNLPQKSSLSHLKMSSSARSVFLQGNRNRSWKVSLDSLRH